MTQPPDRLDRIEALVERNTQAISDLTQLTQRSYEDMVGMFTQFAEEAAADRQAVRDQMAQFANQAAEDRAAIREAIAAMFRHQSNGGGQV